MAPVLTVSPGTHHQNLQGAIGVDSEFTLQAKLAPRLELIYRVQVLKVCKTVIGPSFAIYLSLLVQGCYCTHFNDKNDLPPLC